MIKNMYCKQVCKTNRCANQTKCETKCMMELGDREQCQYICCWPTNLRAGMHWVSCFVLQTSQFQSVSLLDVSLLMMQELVEINSCEYEYLVATHLIVFFRTNLSWWFSWNKHLWSWSSLFKSTSWARASLGSLSFSTTSASPAPLS